jgi:hypothetical protein
MYSAKNNLIKEKVVVLFFFILVLMYHGIGRAGHSEACHPTREPHLCRGV